MDVLTHKMFMDFSNGTATRSQSVFGSHFTNQNNKDGVVFRTWAPNAKSVCVVGDFNNWQIGHSVMQKISKTGAWTIFIENVKSLDCYKYAIETLDGEILLKSDPFAKYYEKHPANASRVINISNFKWADKRWIKARSKNKSQVMPINIYQVDISSWCAFDTKETLNYENIANQLSAYVKDMAYTHVEIMTIAEHSSDNLLANDIYGFFSPTSRFGTPEQLMSFINIMHKSGIGVILNWVPTSFSTSQHTLYQYDGTACFEAMESCPKENRVDFNFANAHVQNFLISSALFWVEQYHIDGIRISDTTFVNYNNKILDNHFILFLKTLSTTILKDNPDIILIYEDHSSLPMLTKPISECGIGFSFKWNTKWIENILEYLATNSVYRNSNHEKLIYNMSYNINEKFVLPVSLSDFNINKEFLISKLTSKNSVIFSEYRVFLGYMMSLPGKKLIFMGNEFAHTGYWDNDRELDWSLINIEAHSNVQNYMRVLNKFYIENSELWQVEDSWDGFKWAVSDDVTQNIIVFRRINEKGKEIMVVCNFSLIEHGGYRIGVPDYLSYTQVLCSEDEEFGGNGSLNSSEIYCEEIPYHGQQYSIAIHIPAMCVMWFKPKKRKKEIKFTTITQRNALTTGLL